MAMNIDRHVKAHRDLYDHLANGELEKAAATKAFYDEYFAVLDLTAEFYIETVKLVFQEAALPHGKLTFRGVPVEPRAIRRTMLLTVEGERDDICAVGQTLAAHDLCSGAAAQSQAPPSAARRRPLRRVQRQPLDQPDLPDHQERDPLQRVSGASCSLSPRAGRDHAVRVRASNRLLGACSEKRTCPKML